LINQSKFDDAQREFVKWNKAGGKIMDGLTLRRKAEACLFSTGQVKFDFSRDAATQDYLA
jgi:GH24 family phage-related lysozyme (muramidase)